MYPESSSIEEDGHVTNNSHPIIMWRALYKEFILLVFF